MIIENDDGVPALVQNVYVEHLGGKTIWVSFEFFDGTRFYGALEIEARSGSPDDVQWDKFATGIAQGVSVDYWRYLKRLADTGERNVWWPGLRYTSTDDGVRVEMNL